MRYIYHTEQWLPHPVEQIFAFFADPDNLPTLMPAWQDARIETATIVPPEPTNSAAIKAAGSGSQLTLSFRPFPRSPFRVHWVAQIDDFVWNGHFCDRQIQGPFAYWNHCHYLSRTERSGIDGTLIVDDLEYELPFGLTGELAHKIFLRRRIEQTFAFRQAQLARIFAQTKQATQLTEPHSPPLQ